MAVVHIFWSLGYGGIETMLVNIANAQVSLGAEVHIIVINELMEKSLVDNLDNRVHYYCLGRQSKSKNLCFIIKLNRQLKYLNPDVIHLHGSEFYAVILNKGMQKKVCSTLHALPYGNLRRKSFIAKMFPILNFHIRGNVSCIDKIPHVYSISKSVQYALKKEYGVNSYVIENGVLTGDFKQRENKPLASNKPFRIVCVSRLEHETKGQDLLIKAAAQMKGDIELTLIGDGRSRDFLIRLASVYKRGGILSKCQGRSHRSI